MLLHAYAFVTKLLSEISMPDGWRNRQESKKESTCDYQPLNKKDLNNSYKNS